MKNTITECISGNTIARMNSLLHFWIPLGLLFLLHKENQIKLFGNTQLYVQKQQNIDISSNNEMKSTITGVYLWKYDSQDEFLFTFGFLSVCSFLLHKENQIKLFGNTQLYVQKQQNIDISSNNEMKNTITECISGNTIARILNFFSLLDSRISVCSSFYIRKIR